MISNIFNLGGMALIRGTELTTGGVSYSALAIEYSDENVKNI